MHLPSDLSIDKVETIMHVKAARTIPTTKGFGIYAIRQGMRMTIYPFKTTTDSIERLHDSVLHCLNRDRWLSTTLMFIRQGLS